jgi:tRNA/rRNA methyltransferase
MANFGFGRLYLVAPPIGWRDSEELLAMASGHDQAWRSTLCVGSLTELRPHFSQLLGFTRRGGGYRPIHGGLEELGRQLSGAGRAGTSALVFGNERTGLSQAEAAECSALYSIESAKESGSLNLALAAGIAMHAVAADMKRIGIQPDQGQPLVRSVSAEEVAMRAAELAGTLALTGVFDKGKDSREDAETYVRRVLERAQLSPFESAWLQKMALRMRPFVRNTKG